MITYYCTTIEEALRRVKRAVKVAIPGCLIPGCLIPGCLIPGGKKKKLLHPIHSRGGLIIGRGR